MLCIPIKRAIERQRNARRPRALRKNELSSTALVLDLRFVRHDLFLAEGGKSLEIIERGDVAFEPVTFKMPPVERRVLPRMNEQ
jgi:hypothetical protein